MNVIREEAARVVTAAQLLTRFPLPDVVQYSKARSRAAARYYPLVGVMIGLLAALVHLAAIELFPVSLAALVIVVVTLMMTGALHEDGFADCCDGLGGGRTRERALEIMRDSRLGTYGAAGLGLMLLGQLLVVMETPSALVPWLLIAAHATSRAAMVLVICVSDYARAEGSAAQVSGGPGTHGLIIALVIAAMSMIPLALGAPVGAAVLALAALVAGALVMHRYARRKLGGYTGDTLGAVQQVSQLAFGLGLLAGLRVFAG